MNVNQNHYGPGDNISGNKYEYIVQSINAGDLFSVVEDVMKDVRYRELEKANLKLTVIENINSLSHEVRLLLNTLKAKVDLASQIKTSARNDILTLLKAQGVSEDTLNVATSILINLESTTSEAQARKRFTSVDSSNVYIREAFFEFLASETELKSEIQNINLSEQEITGLVRGAIRVKDFQIAQILATRLNLEFPSKNAQILQLHIEVLALVEKNREKHFFSLHINDKHFIDKTVDILPEYIDEKLDFRVVYIIINLLELTFYLDKKLRKIAISHIARIRALSPECAETLDSILTGAPTKDIGFELGDTPLSIEQFTSLHFALQQKRIASDQVSKWIDSGGKIHTGDEYFNEFCDLYIRSLLCAVDDNRDKHLLDERAKTFLKSNPQRFLLINPHRLLNLCEIFIELGLPLNAVDYLAPLLSDSPWVSPVFECFIDALFYSEKYSLFFSMIGHLDNEEKSEIIFIREAQIYERTGDYHNAILAIRSALNRYPNNPYSWLILLHAARANGLSEDDLKKIVFEIPNTIFANYDDSKVTLINEIAVNIDAHLAERILVDWFVENPTAVAKPLTQIHANILLKNKEYTKNPYAPEKCGEGITYSDGFETFTRILVNDVDVIHPALLNVKSPLGQILINLQQGEVSGQLEMIERTSPYTAAFALAIELRSFGNDGTDAFKRFQLPEDKTQHLGYIEKVLASYSSHDAKRNELLESPKIPLSMRGMLIDPGNSVKAALTNLTTWGYAKHISLFNGGEENPDKIVIDVYTAVYISLMGFSSALVSGNMQIIICEFTKKVISSWLQDVLRDNFMSIGISENGLYKITSQDIRKDSTGLIEGLQILLERAHVEPLKAADTPEVLVEFREHLDESVYSSFRLSAANNIPILCVDSLMCEVAFRAGIPIANLNTFVEGILRTLTPKERKKSVKLNLYAGTPVSILYSDIIELSRSSDDSDVHLVYKFIEKYGDSIKESGYKLYFLTSVLKNVTLGAYVEGGLLNRNGYLNLDYYGFTKHAFNYCCRSALSNLEGGTAEQRLAKLIFSVLDIPLRNRLGRYSAMVMMLASEFAAGHFLDFEALNDAFSYYERNQLTQE